jgi:DNA repair protein RecO (recombination protein O)
MIVSTKAIVLSKLKYKDHDLIVKCYTASNGVMSFLVKGTFSSKKGKLKPAYFQPLSMLQIEVDIKITEIYIILKMFDYYILTSRFILRF